MIYKVLIGLDTGGGPIYRWHCDCEVCLTSPNPCATVVDANKAEKDKPQNTAIYASLRR